MKAIEEMSTEEVATVASLGEAIENMAKATEWLDAMREQRDQALTGLRRLGWTIADVSAVSGLSTTFVHKATTAVPA